MLTFFASIRLGKKERLCSGNFLRGIFITSFVNQSIHGYKLIIYYCTIKDKHNSKVFFP